MKNTFGNSVAVTLFGESHGAYIGAVLDGLAPGIPVNEEHIRFCLQKRAPRGAISTPRREKDAFVLASGVKNGFTTGTPLTVLIPNEDVKSADYEKNADLPRPGHADYTAECKYHGFQDVCGGGHFSGRLTAPLVAVGAICQDALEQKGIFIGTRIRRLAGVEDAPFVPTTDIIQALTQKDFPVLDDRAGEKMKNAVLLAKEQKDSVGGILETAVTGVPAGLGEPWFDTVEGVLAHALFSVPAVKGVEFGAGFALADMRGSCANDPMAYEDGVLTHLSNHSGGVIGGITNAMPLVFRCAIKPTPSIGWEQQTVNLKTGENAALALQGRHDPAVVPRAAQVISAVTALVLCDMAAGRFGTDWFCKD